MTSSRPWLVYSFSRCVAICVERNGARDVLGVKALAAFARSLGQPRLIIQSGGEHSIVEFVRQTCDESPRARQPRFFFVPKVFFPPQGFFFFSQVFFFFFPPPPPPPPLSPSPQGFFFSFFSPPLFFFFFFFLPPVVLSFPLSLLPRVLSFFSTQGFSAWLWNAQSLELP